MEIRAIGAITSVESSRIQQQLDVRARRAEAEDRQRQSRQVDQAATDTARLTRRQEIIDIQVRRQTIELEVSRRDPARSTRVPAAGEDNRRPDLGNIRFDPSRPPGSLLNILV